MSFKSEFVEVYNYLSAVCKDPIFTIPYASESDFWWKDDDHKSGVIIKYNGKDPVVKVPKGVVKIGSRNAAGKYDSEGDHGCFENCKHITDVILPKSLKIIGCYAFCSCDKLTSIVIPNGVTNIGVFAFEECTNLTSIIIPNSVTSIEYSAFWRSGLTSITCSADLDLSKAKVPEVCEVIRR